MIRPYVIRIDIEGTHHDKYLCKIIQAVLSTKVTDLH